MKLTVTGSKNSVSFYVQKSIRKPDGKVSSVTVEKLGNLDEVRARANGMDPYVWAQEYVNELNRKEYEQQKEIIVSFAPTKLLKKGEPKSFNCGYLFLQKIYYGLGLDKICQKITSRHTFEYDLNEILSRLIYNRILFPCSKLAAHQQSRDFIEQPHFELHDIYRALSVLAEESDYIQAELYKNSQKMMERRSDVLYYDCTNYYFELEEADELRRYGKSKQHQPLPLVGMGLFMDYDGIPLAFDIYPGNKNEQPTMKPIEQRILNDYGIENVIVCTDAGLSSVPNRKFNDRTIKDVQVRSFITTQSIKQLPDYLREYALDPKGWSLPGSDRTYNLDEISREEHMDCIFYKDRWITEDISGKKLREGAKPLEQHLIVSYSMKYRDYQRKIRQGQIERAQAMINSGQYKQRSRNQNDPHRFIGHQLITKEGEVCSQDIPYLNTNVIANEEMYDGFYAVCTNLDDMNVEQIVRINKKRWQIEECFRIMKTELKARPVYLQREDRIKAHFITCFIALFVYRILEKQLKEQYTCGELIETMRSMRMYRHGEKMGYMPAYMRTDITDALHENAGFRTDYEILTDINMKRVIRSSRTGKSKSSSKSASK